MTMASPPMPSASDEHRTPSFDYYGNPITGEQLQPQQQSQLRQQQLHVVHQPTQPAYQSADFAWESPRDDYSEFLELNPVPTSKVENRTSDAEVEQGCVAEFGQFMKSSLCCAADESLIQAAVAEENNMQDAMMREINNELQSLRHATQEANTYKVMAEFELRSEIANIRRQKAEMEESYRFEIARESSQKALQQAQLQQQLMSIMEERMKVEARLSQLNSSLKQAPEPQPTQDEDPILIATPTHMNQPLGSIEKLSQLSIVSSKVEHIPSPKKAADPPMVDPTFLTTAPKSAMRATNFGLSVVVENGASNNGSDPGGSGSCTIELNEELMSPTTGRSPPGKNRKCEPEGSLGDIDSITGSRSPCYNSLPLPVASPVMQLRAAIRGYGAAE
mmetsp:Transcript_24668/g.59480  ORF Transcript_24668/g.59480 Transcript_24668/m.59480 type:complete len:391 (+) Transcript_24668:3-1175(+)